MKQSLRKKYTIRHTELDKYFWTADLHFFHKAILKFHEARSGFHNVDDMNDFLVQKWNYVVPKDGRTFILGDVSFGKPDETIEVLERLNGSKVLIVGNHDFYMTKEVQTCFADVHLYAECDVRLQSGFVQRMTMCHFPLRSWNKMHHGSWNLHGHSHGSMEPIGKQLDVGVDCHNLYPLSYNDIHWHMLQKKVVKVDHHEVK